jgi:hypothetical protein
MAFPSTFQDTQNAVLKRLRLDATNDLQKVKDWINQAYTQVVVETECLQKRATMTLTVNGAIYTLPSAVIRLKYVTIRGSGQSEYGPPLEEATVDDLLNWRRSSGGVNAASAVPTHYALVGLNQFELWPPPAAADTMLVYYVYLPTALSANGDVAVLQEPWNSRLLEYGALVEASDYIDVPKSDVYRQWYDLWMGRFRQHLVRRGGGNVRQIQLLDDRVYVPHDPSVDLGYFHP